jgi:hypothetical protein
MKRVNSIADLSEHKHTLQLLPRHKTSFRALALVLAAAIFLVYAFNL